MVTIPGPHTLQRAKELETAGNVVDAVKMYHAIVSDNQRSNPPLAAQALYEGGVFTTDAKRFGTTPERVAEGQADAAQMYRQLRDEWTQLQGDKATDAAGHPLLKEDVEARYDAVTRAIDTRNSKDWKYQIIDTLVKLCGGKSYSYGLALILLAVMVKLILFPLTRKQYASQREMQRMQPLIKELQKKYKGAELNQKQMELYKEHGVNPFAGCGPMVLQLPFIILMFTAIRYYEYRFVNGHFLWIGSPLATMYPGVVAGNLAMPDVPLLAIYAVTNYITMRLNPAADPAQQQQQNSMALMTSGLFFYMFLSYKWSSAFVLYWLAQNMITIWQQYHFVYQPHKQRLASGEVLPPPSGSSSNGSGQAAKDASPIAQARQPERVRPRKKKK